MESIQALNTTSSQSQTTGNSLNSLNTDDFLKLMISELQNQDPLEPMDNAQLAEQLGQIRNIGATDHLTETLDAVLIGQNLATASNLIGKQINALNESGENLTGVVDRVSVDPDGSGAARNIRVHIGEQSIQLENVREILPQANLNY